MFSGSSWKRVGDFDVLIVLKPLWILCFLAHRSVLKTGTIYRCSKLARAFADSPTRMRSGAFVHVPGCVGCSGIRRLGSSRLFGGQKNCLRRVWNDATRMVRPAYAAHSRPVVRRHAGVPRARGAPCSVPMLWHGEARAPRLSGRQSVLHEAICLLRRPALPQRDDSDRKSTRLNSSHAD